MSMTLLLVVVTTAVTLAAWVWPRLHEALVYWPPGVARGQWWRLLGHGFIHADGTHLLFNMITLYFFGTVMELVLTPRIGPWGFLLFYLSGLLVAILPTHLRHRRDARFLSLGASGAVAALLFAYVLLRPWSLLFVLFIPVPAILFAVAYVIYSLRAQLRGGDRINHSAHLWGGVWGIAFMLLLEPALALRFLEAVTSPASGSLWQG